MTNPPERSFSEAMELASKEPVTDELRAVYSAYTDSQRRLQSTEADAERAREPVLLSTRAGRLIETWAIDRAQEMWRKWWHPDGTSVNMVGDIAVALHTARAEGIAQGRAEIERLKAAATRLVEEDGYHGSLVPASRQTEDDNIESFLDDCEAAVAVLETRSSRL